MIAMIQPLAAGNALKVILDAPCHALKLRLLRKVTPTFSGYDDPAAYLVFDQIEPMALDAAGLVNGTLYYYCAFYLIGSTWTPSAVVSATPAATYSDKFGDVLSIVRERLDLGLQAELARGAILHDQDHIPVLTAPPIMEQNPFPLVTVHLTSEAPGERSVGEMPFPDVFDTDGFAWAEAEGWLARVQLTIMGWSTNPDERIELRKALRRIVVANMPIFDFAGMVEINFDQQDMEDFGSFGVPVYQVLCTFSCMAPVVVGSDVGAVREVITTITDKTEC